MIKPTLIAILGALTLSVGVADVAMAQQNREHDARQAQPNRDSRGRRGQPAPPVQETPEQSLAAAQVALTAMNAPCTATEAKLLGETAEHIKVYEAVCSTGPGYIIQTTAPPTGENCLLLDSAARTARERDPAADVGTLCTLPANQNLQAVMQDYATRAGVPCAINESLAIGKTSTGAVLYEVGCEGTDGWRLEQSGDAFTKVSCLRLASQNYTCRFTTKEEQIEDVKKLLAGTDAAACDPAALRYMGANANGEFVEAKCAAEGQGFIVRVKDGLTQQVYPCATAQNIGGGCTLTTAAAAPATEQ